MASDKSVMAVIRASRPTFRNKYDKIAFAIHASFSASGYVLTATGSQAVSDSALSNPSKGIHILYWFLFFHSQNLIFVYKNGFFLCFCV